MRLVVEAGPATKVRRGHPWIFREAIARGRSKGAAPRTGDVVELVDPRGEPLGLGLYDEHSPIAVRVYARPPERRLDEGRLLAAITRAIAARAPFVDTAVTDAYRLCNGEGDRVPGLVLDRYGPFVVARTDGAAMRAWFERLAPRLRSPLASIGATTLLLRGDGAEGGAKATVVWGDEPPELVDVREHGMRFEVDLRHGQKTGAFLDQRENRRRVRELARGRGRVLNLFSYTGGFSLAAALGGAREVTSVDVAAKAHGTAQRSFRANGLDAAAHRFVTADALAWIESAAARGDRFDLVISDPPSFAPNERSVERALGAYAKLHRACAALLSEGGIFCAASCSSHVGMDAFLTTLDDGALGRADLSVRAMFGPPEDHPSVAVFPEGRYLKFVVLS
jgi:23S rRNA (cytosine1962-C5)-methyltransferase